MADRVRSVSVVGIAGPDREAVVDALNGIDVPVGSVGPSDELPSHEPTAFVATDEGALVALAQARVAGPVLAVDTGPRFARVSRDVAPSAVRQLLDGSLRTAPQPILAVTIDEATIGHGMFDVLLVTDEPAQISEYTVSAGDRSLATVRADGVVAATPSGSDGYARAAGGPVLGPQTDAIAIVPIAPFRTAHDRWVVDTDTPPVLTVEREEHPVTVVIDGSAAGPAPVGAPISLRRDGLLDLVLSPP